jgi:flavin-dependent dehydrogenase
MVARTRALGVEVREGAGLVTLDTSAERIHVELSDGTAIDAAFVVAADGHWSPVRRLREPDASPDLAAWQAFRQYFHGVADHRQWVVFERDLLPGYAWVFPLPGGGANVGFGVLRDANTSGKMLNALWADVITRPSLTSILGPDAEPDGPHRAWPIPADYVPARLTDGRILYVGDAAGVVDPMTGEGIAQALESGMLAAGAVTRGGSVDAVAQRYRRTVHRALGRDLRFAAFLQPLLASPLGARVTIRGAALTPWIRRNFARWMFEDYPRALALTPDRWHRNMWDARGAYRS